MSTVPHTPYDWSYEDEDIELPFEDLGPIQTVEVEGDERGESEEEEEPSS